MFALALSCTDDEVEIRESLQSATGIIVASAPVGTLPGTLEVAHDGSAHYRLPIEVLPAMAELSPTLTLEYGSRGGNGLVGVGWSLAGLSSITRCGATFGRDGANRGVSYDSSDHFCLDGQRLVALSFNANGSPQELRTEPDTGIKIWVNHSDVRGPIEWSVYRRDGRIDRYGNTADSRIETDVRLAWAIAYTTDRRNNLITYSYLTSNTGGIARQLPSMILYTSGTQVAADRRISFAYTGRGDPISGFHAGTAVVTDSLLSTISLETALGATWTPARSYVLAYETSARTGRSRLHSAKVCDRAGTCLPPTLFEYTSDTPLGFSELPTLSGPLGDATNPFFPLDPFVTEHGLLIADFDGDGADDVLFYGGSAFTGKHWYVRRGSPPGTPLGLGPILPVDLPGAARLKRVADINGDGAADLLDCAAPSGGCTPQFLLAQRGAPGTVSFSGPSALYDPHDNATDPRLRAVFDADGDGALDYVSLPQTQSPGLGLSILFWSPLTQRWSSPYFPVGARTGDYSDDFFRDADGDGQPDLFQSFTTATLDLNGGPLYHYSIRHIRGGGVHTTDVEADPIPSLYYSLGDVSVTPFMKAGSKLFACDVWLDANGDGLLDLARFGLPTPRILLNTGRGFVDAGPLPEFSNRGVCFNNDAGFRVVDFNGDGLQDILGLGSDTGTSTHAYAMITQPRADRMVSMQLRHTSSGLVLPPLIKPFAFEDASYRRMLDVNGDGLYDILQIAADGSYQLFVQQGEPADLLTRVTNGFGAKQGVDYRALTAGSPSYRKNPACPGAACAFPERPFVGPLWVVSTEYVDDGMTFTGAIAHTYGDGRLDTQGEGFLGFGEHLVTDTRPAGTGSVLTRSDLTRIFDGQASRYPFRDRPSEIITFVQEPTENNRYHMTDAQYVNREVLGDGGLTHVPYTRATQVRRYVSPGMTFDPAAPSWSSQVLMGATVSVTSIDRFGNPFASRTVSGLGATYNTTGSASYCGRTETDYPAGSPDYTTECTDYQTPDTAGWLVALPTRLVVTSNSANGATTRTMTATYNTFGELVETVREPTGGLGTYERTRIDRDNAQACGNAGLPTSITVFPDGTDSNPAARTTRYFYDPNCLLPAIVIDPLGQGTLMAFDRALVMPTTVYSIDGLATAIDRDGFGRIAKVTAPDGTWVRTDRSGSPNAPPTVMRSRSDVAWFDTQTTFDRLGRGVQRVSIEGPVSCADFATCSGQIQLAFTETTYDPFGRIASVTRPHNGGPLHTMFYAYDRLGRPTSVKRDNTFVEGWGYDSGGTGSGITQVVHGDVASVEQIYLDDQGRLQRRMDGAGFTNFGYGPFGDLAVVTDARGNRVTMTYDALGRPLSLRDPDISTTGTVETRYSVDTVNGYSQVIVTDAKGQTTTSSFDKLGRPVLRVAPDGTDSWQWGTAGVATGKLRQASRDGVTTTYTYDSSLGRLTNEHRVIDGAAFDYDYTYDAQGRVDTIAYPVAPFRARFAVRNLYNAFGRLYSVADMTTGTPRPLWTATTGDLEGHITQETLGNGLTTTRTFFPDSGWLQRTMTPGIHDAGYTYASNGNLTTRTDYLNGAAGVQRTESFTYDAANRLASATIAGRTPATISWIYDPLGNVMSASDWTCTNLVYGGTGAGPHQLRQATCGGAIKTFSYDADGNETQATWPDVRQEAWTSFDKVREIDSRFGRMQYTYDADHVRVKKQVVAGGLGNAPPQLPAINSTASGVWSTTLFVGAGYEQRTSSTVPTIDHVFHVRAGDRPIAELVWHQSKTAASGTEDWRYLYADYQGTIERTTTATGGLAERMSADPWGARRDPDWTKTAYPAVASTTRIGYTGHAYDDEFAAIAPSGEHGELIDMGGREYDSYFKRFTSADPIVADPLRGKSWNRYSYVHDNPLRYTDPTGHHCVSPEWEVCDNSSGPLTLCVGWGCFDATPPGLIFPWDPWGPLRPDVPHPPPRQLRHYPMPPPPEPAAPGVNVKPDPGTQVPGSAPRPRSDVLTPGICHIEALHSFAQRGIQIDEQAQRARMLYQKMYDAGVPLMGDPSRPSTGVQAFYRATDLNRAHDDNVVRGVEALSNGGLATAVSATIMVLRGVDRDSQLASLEIMSSIDQMGQALFARESEFDRTTRSVRAHAEGAYERLQNQGFSDNMARANANPNLRRANTGSVIDKLAKTTMPRDPALSHLMMTPQFKFGPDVFNLSTGTWWDMTTPRSWKRHTAKYNAQFGNGIPITW